VTKWTTSRKPVFDQNVQSNLQMLQALLASARERGVRVVLVELPLNREIVGDSFDAALRRYQKPVTALAAEYDVPYFDLNHEVSIPSADFQDISHLIAPGRVIWQRALAKELARIIHTEDSGGSSG
jgi:lysophospholipase L1-like esterase